jgi:hypothetical protein
VSKLCLGDIVPQPRIATQKGFGGCIVPFFYPTKNLSPKERGALKIARSRLLPHFRGKVGMEVKRNNFAGNYNINPKLNSLTLRGRFREFFVL